MCPEDFPSKISQKNPGCSKIHPEGFTSTQWSFEFQQPGANRPNFTCETVFCCQSRWQGLGRSGNGPEKHMDLT